MKIIIFFLSSLMGEVFSSKITILPLDFWAGLNFFSLLPLAFFKHQWWLKFLEKVYFRSQILERPSIGEYLNISGVPVLPENEIFMFFRMCWWHPEANNTRTQKWSSIVQYSCTSIWDLYAFSKFVCLFVCFFFLKKTSMPPSDIKLCTRSLVD